MLRIFLYGLSKRPKPKTLNAILCDPFDLDIVSGFERPQEKGQRNSGTAGIRARRYEEKAFTPMR
jgi:hypothetical protein